MRTPTLLLSAALLTGLLAAAATADHPRPRARVSAEVEHVVSFPIADGMRRAVIGRDEQGPLLQLDEVVAGRATRAVAVEGAMQGRRWRDFADEAGGLWPGAWNGDRFEFWAWLDGAWQTCAVQPGKTATCGGNPADAMAAARQCDAILTDATSRDACAQAVMAAGREVGSILRACENAFDGDPAELACIQAALTASAPDPAIAACEAAFDGDPNELACLTAVAQVADPKAVVEFCEQRENGDDAELACVRRYAR